MELKLGDVVYNLWWDADNRYYLRRVSIKKIEKDGRYRFSDGTARVPEALGKRFWTDLEQAITTVVEMCTEEKRRCLNKINSELETLKVRKASWEAFDTSVVRVENKV